MITFIPVSLHTGTLDLDVRTGCQSKDGQENGQTSRQEKKDERLAQTDGVKDLILH